jgi:hypothetical protein
LVECYCFAAAAVGERVAGAFHVAVSEDTCFGDGEGVDGVAAVASKRESISKEFEHIRKFRVRLTRYYIPDLHR